MYKYHELKYILKIEKRMPLKCFIFSVLSRFVAEILGFKVCIILKMARRL